MRKLCYFLFFFLWMPQIHAQLSLEITGGPNLSGTEEHEPAEGYHRGLGFASGISVLQDEQPYARAKLSVLYRVLTEVSDRPHLSRNTYEYITIPLTIGLKTDERNYFFGDLGLYMSFFLPGRSRVVYPGEDGLPVHYKDLQSIDLGATAGFGMHIHLSDRFYIAPQIGGFYGMKDLVKEITMEDDLQVYSMNFMISLGYTLQTGMASD